MKNLAIRGGGGSAANHLHLQPEIQYSIYLFPPCPTHFTIVLADNEPYTAEKPHRRVPTQWQTPEPHPNTEEHPASTVDPADKKRPATKAERETTEKPEQIETEGHEQRAPTIDPADTEGSAQAYLQKPTERPAPTIDPRDTEQPEVTEPAQTTEQSKEKQLTSLSPKGMHFLFWYCNFTNFRCVKLTLTFLINEGRSNAFLFTRIMILYFGANGFCFQYHYRYVVALAHSTVRKCTI